MDKLPDKPQWDEMNQMTRVVDRLQQMEGTLRQLVKVLDTPQSTKVDQTLAEAVLYLTMEMRRIAEWVS